MIKVEGILEKRHTEAGLQLQEDEDFIYLSWGSKELARWSALGATRENILAEADKYLDKEAETK